MTSADTPPSTTPSKGYLKLSTEIWSELLLQGLAPLQILLRIPGAFKSGQVKMCRSVQGLKVSVWSLETHSVAQSHAHSFPDWPRLLQHHNGRLNACDRGRIANKLKRPPGPYWKGLLSPAWGGCQAKENKPGPPRGSEILSRTPGHGMWCFEKVCTKTRWLPRLVQTKPPALHSQDQAWPNYEWMNETYDLPSTPSCQHSLNHQIGAESGQHDHGEAEPPLQLCRFFLDRQGCLSYNT